MKNTADVTGGVSAINPLVPFYDIHGGKREVLFFYFVPDTTRDTFTAFHFLILIIFFSGQKRELLFY
jgi:hypothetical protein